MYDRIRRRIASGELEPDARNALGEPRFLATEENAERWIDLCGGVAYLPAVELGWEQLAAARGDARLSGSESESEGEERLPW